MWQYIYSSREIIALREANFRQMKLGKPDPTSCEKTTTTAIAPSPATMAA